MKKKRNDHMLYHTTMIDLTMTNPMCRFFFVVIVIPLYILFWLIDWIITATITLFEWAVNITCIYCLWFLLLACVREFFYKYIPFTTAYMISFSIALTILTGMVAYWDTIIYLLFFADIDMENQQENNEENTDDSVSDNEQDTDDEDHDLSDNEHDDDTDEDHDLSDNEHDTDDTDEDHDLSDNEHDTDDEESCTDDNNMNYDMSKLVHNNETDEYYVFEYTTRFMEKIDARDAETCIKRMDFLDESDLLSLAYDLQYCDDETGCTEIISLNLGGKWFHFYIPAEKYTDFTLSNMRELFADFEPSDEDYITSYYYNIQQYVFDKITSPRICDLPPTSNSEDSSFSDNDSDDPTFDPSENDFEEL